MRCLYILYLRHIHNKVISEHFVQPAPGPPPALPDEPGLLGLAHVHRWPDQEITEGVGGDTHITCTTRRPCVTCRSGGPAGIKSSPHPDPHAWSGRDGGDCASGRATPTVLKVEARDAGEAVEIPSEDNGTHRERAEQSKRAEIWRALNAFQHLVGLRPLRLRAFQGPPPP